MTQDELTNAAKKPLPGLTKLFLAQLCLNAALICLSLYSVLSYKWLGDSERAMLSTLHLVPVILFAFAIYGLHGRARWAPAYTGALCVIMCVLNVLFLLLMFAGIAGGSVDAFAYGKVEDSLIVLIPLQIPIIYAWARYFLSSKKVGDAFGRDRRAAAELPPPGIAIARTIAASSLAVAVCTPFAVMFSDYGPITAHDVIFFILCDFPAIAFSVLILASSASPGRAQKPMLLGVIALALCQLMWPGIIRLVLNAFMKSLNSGYVNVIVVPHISLPTLQILSGLALALLAWKIWADPLEQKWFRNGGKEPRALEFARLCHIVILYFCMAAAITHGYVTFVLGWFELSEGQLNITELNTLTFNALIALGALAAGGLNIAGLCAAGGKKLVSIAAFAFAAVICLAALISTMVFFGMDSTSYLTGYIVPILAGILGLMRLWHISGGAGRAGKGFFSMPSTMLGFALLCLVIFTSAATATGLLLAHMPSGNMWRYLAKYIDNYSIFWAVDLLGAYIVCPVLALFMLRNATRGLRRFYAVCAIWLLCLLPSCARDAARYMTESHFLPDVLSQIYFYGIIIFMAYLACAEKTKAVQNGNGSAFQPCPGQGENLG